MLESRKRLTVRKKKGRASWKKRRRVPNRAGSKGMPTVDEKGGVINRGLGLPTPLYGLHSVQQYPAKLLESRRKMREKQNRNELAEFKLVIAINL